MRFNSISFTASNLRYQTKAVIESIIIKRKGTTPIFSMEKLQKYEIELDLYLIKKFL